MEKTYKTYSKLNNDLCLFIDAFKSARYDSERVELMKFKATEDTHITIKGFYEYNNYIIIVETRGLTYVYSTKDFTPVGYCSIAKEIFNDVYKNRIDAPFIQWEDAKAMSSCCNDKFDVTLNEMDNYGEPCISAVIKLKEMDGKIVVDNFWNCDINQAKDMVAILLRNILKGGK